MARSGTAVPAAPPVALADALPPRNMNEYVVVHRQMPSAEFYRTVSSQSAGGR
jgi:hypothetical protein